MQHRELNMNRLQKAAEFGAMMGKKAAAPTPTESRLIGGAAGAIAGGLGTAGYDWLSGTKKNKLRRALMGAGLGGLTGVGLGQVASLINNKAPQPRPLDEQGLKDKLEQPTGLDPDIGPLSTPDRDAPQFNVNRPSQRDLIDHPRMMHPLAAAGAGQKLLTNEEGRRMAESLRLSNPSRASILGNAKLLKLFDNARERGMHDYNFNHGDIKNNSGAADMINEYFGNSERKGESFPGRNTIPYGRLVVDEGPGTFDLVGKNIPDFKDFNR
jgi:hypothetical protein